MELLAKKVERISRWRKINPLRIPDGIPADCITQCLKTLNNSLSFWKCEDNTKEEAVLAIVSYFKDPGKADIVWLKKSKVEELGISLENSTGKTAVTRLANLHYDMKNLTLNDLKKLAKLMAETINSNADSFRVFDKEENIEIVAIESQKDPQLINRLRGSFKEEIAKRK